MYDEVGNADQSALYTDLTEAGGLGTAIQAQLEAMASPLRVKQEDPKFAGLFPFAWEVVEQGQRFSQIKIAKHQRLFMFDLWDRGVCLAHASTPVLPQVAEAIDAWIAQGVTTGEMQRRFRFFSVEPRAKPHEEGAAAEVEWKWLALHEQIRTGLPQLAPLVEKARDDPLLQFLFPFTSLYSLCFSRCTGYPFSGDCPSACPTSQVRPAVVSSKLYQVSISEGEFPPNSKVLGEGDAAEAVKLIVRHLPPNCGPAIQGTADDLL